MWRTLWIRKRNKQRQMFLHIALSSVQFCVRGNWNLSCSVNMNRNSKTRWSCIKLCILISFRRKRWVLFQFAMSPSVRPVIFLVVSRFPAFTPSPFLVLSAAYLFCSLKFRSVHPAFLVCTQFLSSCIRFLSWTVCVAYPLRNIQSKHKVAL
jgi:hypothetical protein